MQNSSKGIWSTEGNLSKNKTNFTSISDLKNVNCPAIIKAYLPGPSKIRDMPISKDKCYLLWYLPLYKWCPVFNKKTRYKKASNNKKKPHCQETKQWTEPDSAMSQMSKLLDRKLKTNIINIVWNIHLMEKVNNMRQQAKELQQRWKLLVRDNYMSAYTCQNPLSCTLRLGNFMYLK